jgi:ubiquinone/menaquinone biosynthesis C-methylase UbiE
MVNLTAEAKKEFDRWSGGYDRNPLQFFFFRPSHRMLLEAIGPDDRCILDIGCGTGVFADRVLRRFPETHVWGIDLSAGMLRQCQPRCAESGNRFHVVQGNSERLPFKDDAFDVITCTHSFHHYPSQPRVLAEMHRVLRPGGRLFIIDGDRDRWWGWVLFEVLVVLAEGPVRHLGSRTLRHLYHDAGFENVRQRRRRGPLPFLLTCGQAVKSAAVAGATSDQRIPVEKVLTVNK